MGRFTKVLVGVVLLLLVFVAILETAPTGSWALAPDTVENFIFPMCLLGGIAGAILLAAGIFGD